MTFGEGFLTKRAQVPLVDMSAFSMMALDPVWVPYKDGEEIKPHGRHKSVGPDGRLGRWKLALPDGSIYHGPSLSPSALETGSGCVYKWGLNRLGGLPRIQSKNAKLGDDKHVELEAWSTKAEQPTSEGMSKLLTHFPMPGQYEVECYQGFLFGYPGKEFVFSGYLDGRKSILTPDGKLRYPPGSLLPAEVLDEDGNVLADFGMNSVIYDLKTTGDFRWKKSPAELRANVQAAIYGLGEMLRIERAMRDAGVSAAEVQEAASLVILKWVWALLKEQPKNSGKAIITKVETVCEEATGGSTADGKTARGVTLTREQAVATLAQFLPVAETLWKAIENRKQVEDLEKSENECEAFGGCQWKKPQQVLVPILMKKFEEKEKQLGKDWNEEDKKRTKNRAEQGIACEVPGGGGFFAMLAQNRARSGIRDVNGNGIVAVTKITKEPGVKMPSTGLGGRFAKKLNGAQGAQGAQGTQTKPEETKPEEKKSEAGATETPKSGGLGGRFANRKAAGGTVTQSSKPSTTPTGGDAQSTKQEEPKLQQKAITDGPASSVQAKDTTPTPGAGGTLQDRLNAVANKAVSAPTTTHKVSEQLQGEGLATDGLARGVNPPDASPEWTQEQQDAEAQRLGAPGDKKKKDEKSDAQPSAVARATPGRRGSKKASDAAKATDAKATESATGATSAGATSAGATSAGAEAQTSLIEQKDASGRTMLVQRDDSTVMSRADSEKVAQIVEQTDSLIPSVIMRLDGMVAELMKSGHRREAGILLEASGRIV